MICSLSRTLVLAWGLGLVVATLSGRDAVGWVVAGLVVLAAVGLRRLRSDGTANACSLPGPAAERRR